MESFASAEAVERTASAPKSIKEQLLGALAGGARTAREIADVTKLNLSQIIREAEVLDKIYLTIRPAPPVVTYWLIGEEPKGKLVRENGQLIELPLENGPDLSGVIEQRNREIREQNVPASFDVSSHSLPAGDEYRDLPIDLVIVHPHNIRGAINTDETEFQNLLASVVEQGIQEPLIVTPHENTGKFRVVMGNRRRTAAEVGGLRTVPCVIRHYESPTAELTVMLIENIQRSGLKPMQEARAFKRLYAESGKDVHAVARLTGLTQSYITTRLRLLKLAPELQEMVDRREIGIGPAAIVGTLDPEVQLKIRTRIPGRKASEVKQLVEQVRTTGLLRAPSKPKLLPDIDRVTSDSENFTRGSAINAIAKLGDAWFKAEHLRASFDDVCLDTCHGSKDETYCYTCPIPRFITSIVRRAEKANDE